MKTGEYEVSIFLPFHIGSGNRGCEAITRATAQLLGMEKSRIHIMTGEKKEDRNVGLHKIVCLDEITRHAIFSPKIRQAISYLNRQLGIDLETALSYYKFLKQPQRGDVVLITGGDLYCYPATIWKLRWVSWLARVKGCRIILWGCSIEEKSLSKRMINHLKKYDAIYARECLTKEYLQSHGVKKVKFIPDSAFILEPCSCKLPVGISEKNILGINVSSFTNGSNDSVSTTFYKNIANLIRYIIKHSDMQILLIPHVFWDGQDDRILSKKIYRQFKNSNRIFLLNSEKLSYCQIRYVISRCRFFVGARTHSMISAYAMKIPALALGYSVKSRGIARDLGLPDELVVNCTELKSETEILERYLYLFDHKDQIKQILSNRMPKYLSRITPIKMKN